MPSHGRAPQEQRSPAKTDRCYAVRAAPGDPTAGLPFASDVDDVFDGVMQHLGPTLFSTKRRASSSSRGSWGRARLSSWRAVSRGLSGAPIDVAGRIGMET